MIPGKDVVIGDKTYTLPPLSLGQLRNGMMEKLRAHDALLAEDPPKGWEAFVAKGEIILAALRRNYPDLKAEELDDLIDLGNVMDLWSTVLGLTGFMPGEALATREPTLTGSGT